MVLLRVVCTPVHPHPWVFNRGLFRFLSSAVRRGATNLGRNFSRVVVMDADEFWHPVELARSVSKARNLCGVNGMLSHVLACLVISKCFFFAFFPSVDNDSLLHSHHSRFVSSFCVQPTLYFLSEVRSTVESMNLDVRGPFNHFTSSTRRNSVLHRQYSFSRTTCASFHESSTPCVIADFVSYPCL